MKTVLTTLPTEAAAILKGGGVVAFPTETVYGLGADVFDATAIAKIFVAKRRPADNPLIAHVATRSHIEQLASEITESAEKFIDAFFPGPLTVVLRKKDGVPEIATAGLDTIGIRMPGSETARSFLKACGTPVVAPSANISGRPSPTTWASVLEDLDGRIDCVLQGESTQIGLESTVVDCTRDVPVVLRFGSVTLEQLRAVVPSTQEFAGGVAGAAMSPGMKHKHYSPRARVVILGGTGPEPRSLRLPVLTPDAAFIGLLKPEGEFKIARVCDTVEEYAHDLYEFFRECDRADAETIYCEALHETGIGAALMDRIRRAAED